MRDNVVYRKGLAFTVLMVTALLMAGAGVLMDMSSAMLEWARGELDV